VAETQKQELAERLAHVPKIQVSTPKWYGFPTAGGKWEKECPYSGIMLALTKEQWDARDQEFMEKEAAERRVKLEEEAKQRAEEGKKYAASLPTKQRYIQGAQKAKRVLGRNKVLGVVLRNHDVKIMLGDKELIIPANVRDTDRDFTHVMLASTFIRVIAVCPITQINWLKHWWLVLAKFRLMRGKRGPIVEIAPGSGLPRRGEGGEACIFIDAEWCMMQYPDPEEEEQVSKSSASSSFAGCDSDSGERKQGLRWLAPLRSLRHLIRRKETA
jgi:hypothetical protein